MNHPDRCCFLEIREPAVFFDRCDPIYFLNSVSKANLNWQTRPDSFFESTSKVILNWQMRLDSFFESVGKTIFNWQIVLDLFFEFHQQSDFQLAKINRLIKAPHFYSHYIMILVPFCFCIASLKHTDLLTPHRQRPS